MSKEFQEPEERELNESNKEIFDDFSPLDEAVNEKEYTRPNVRFNSNDISGDIPEPSFMPPPMTEPMNPEQKAKKPVEPLNPQTNELSNKDKHDAAEKMADLFITGYKMLWGFIDNRMLFDERKIMKMEADGEIDLSVPIPVSPTQTLTAGEFIEEFNSQTKGTLVVTQEFEDEVKPPLIRVLKKRGILLTDEQQIMFAVGKDTLTKGFMAYQSYKVKGDILIQLKEMNQLLKQQSIPTPPPQPAPMSMPQYDEPVYDEPTIPSTPPPTPPSPMTPTPTQYQETPVYPKRSANQAPDVNEIVNTMTGSYVPMDEDFQEQDENESFADSDDNGYQEPKPEVKIISEGKKPKRGRPKKK